MLAAPGRKYLREPCGTGFLYVRRDTIGILEPPFIDLEAASWVDADQLRRPDDARRLANWECFVAGQIGLGGRPLRDAGGIVVIEARVRALGALPRRELAKRPGISVHDLGAGSSPCLKDGEAPGRTRDGLRAVNINAHVSRSPRAPALDLSARGVGALVRAGAG